MSPRYLLFPMLMAEDGAFSPGSVSGSDSPRRMTYLASLSLSSDARGGRSKLVLVSADEITNFSLLEAVILFADKAINSVNCRVEAGELTAERREPIDACWALYFAALALVSTVSLVDESSGLVSFTRRRFSYPDLRNRSRKLDASCRLENSPIRTENSFSFSLKLTDSGSKNFFLSSSRSFRASRISFDEPTLTRKIEVVDKRGSIFRRCCRHSIVNWPLGIVSLWIRPATS